MPSFVCVTFFIKQYILECITESNIMQIYHLALILYENDQKRRSSDYYERASAASERFHTELKENPEYERPAVGTLFKS